MKKHILQVILILLLLTACSSSTEDYLEIRIHNPLLFSGTIDSVPPPNLSARSVTSVDAATGRVLYSKNSTEIIPPASMTKLVTLALLYEDIKEGLYKEDTVITVSDEGDFRTLPPRSSLMFLEKGQKITVLELMKGLAVPSGNDAAITAAVLSAGSVEQFIKKMNSFVKSLGLDNTVFYDASGLDSRNATTSGDFAEFCLYYFRQYPESVEKLHSIREFTYPLRHNLALSGTSARGPIKQYSNNQLLERLEGVDGFKTGYIDASGYNFAVTAERGGRRVIAVIMGIDAESAADGFMKRAVEAAAVLNYSFDNYHYFTPAPGAGAVKVRFGEQKEVNLQNSRTRRLLLSTEELAAVSMRLFIAKSLAAPVAAGEKAGYGELFLDGRVISVWDITAEKDVLRKKFFLF